MISVGPDRNHRLDQFDHYAIAMDWWTLLARRRKVLAVGMWLPFLTRLFPLRIVYAACMS